MLTLITGGTQEAVKNYGEEEERVRTSGGSLLVYRLTLAIEGPRDIGFEVRVNAVTGRVVTILKGKLGPKPGDGS
ncbi:MAG: hypothetical protein U0S12_01170 [Fimbriimonadales bacterium]